MYKTFTYSHTHTMIYIYLLYAYNNFDKVCLQIVRIVVLVHTYAFLVNLTADLTGKSLSDFYFKYILISK